jgi:virginiamycin B lyase
MRVSGFLTTGVLLLATSPLPAQQVHDERSLNLREWSVEFGGQTRDPFVASDGRVWFVAQRGNYFATFDPATERFTRYELEEGTVPHDILEDREGFIWYASLGNGHIGKVDPATGQRIQRFETGATRVNTMAFDQKGDLWFTNGVGNSTIGRLQPSTGKVDLVTPVVGIATGSRPYGLDIDPSGRAWTPLFETNVMAATDPNLNVKLYRMPHEASRPRRTAVTADGMVWYGDYPRGRLGRIDPATGEVKEWLAPGGEQAAPYGIMADDQGRIWFSETGEPKRIVGFDPRTEKFFAIVPVSGTIRNFFFDKETGMLWFGTDANFIGRILTRPAAT